MGVIYCRFRRKHSRLVVNFFFYMYRVLVKDNIVQNFPDDFAGSLTTTQAPGENVNFRIYTGMIKRQHHLTR